MTQLAANLSMLFNEHDFLDRFEAAAKAGFKGVEYLFPYAFEAEVLAEKLKQNDLTQVLFNLPAGDWDAGDRGIACDPARQEEFRAGVDQAIAYAEILGNKLINCLAGIPPEGVNAAAAEATFIDNLKYAATKLKEADIKLVIEAINTIDIPGFFLTNTQQALDIRNKAGSDNLYLQYDIYHMQIMEGDLARTMEKHLDAIGHIQLADNPGRHEPGTGEINYYFLLKHLNLIGYQGWIGCEYKPANHTVPGLSWLHTHDVH
ncbi:MAG: hydroxypyruvate isomerase [Candidatus Sedimenticola endophacoides]|nr:MAG: hydroxypyruvate isomerase [Candidatus Sedimenticola endophacoides]